MGFGVWVSVLWIWDLGFQCSGVSDSGVNGLFLLQSAGVGVLGVGSGVSGSGFRVGSYSVPFWSGPPQIVHACSSLRVEGLWLRVEG